MEILANANEYEGSRDFKRNWVHEVFTDKLLKFDARNPRAADDADFEYFVSSKEWFAYQTLYATSEEKAFVRMLYLQMLKLQELYDSIYLIRNEGHFKIFNFRDGQHFEPDFVIFLQEKSGEIAGLSTIRRTEGKTS